MSVTLNASTSSGLVQTADTSGTIELQSNGTTKLTVSSAGAYGQLVSATAQASTSGTAIDFTGIPSWVKRITVMFSGVSTSGTSNLLIQLGDSGGFETTGYVSSGGSYTPTPANTIGSSTAGFLVTGSIAAANTVSGLLVITNLTGNSWVEAGNGKIGTGGTFSSAGDKTLSDVLTQLRITTVNGTDTFDAGTINLLYEG